jgi:hypothetical protein
MEFKKIILTILIFIGLLGTANAAAGLNVILANQNPDPVSPGNFVYLNVKISNIGDEQIKVDEIKMIENENFKIAKGEDISRNLGILSAYSTSDNSKSFVVEKYKVLVDEDTPSGLNNVDFEVLTDNGKVTYEFDVFVQDNNPIIFVKNIETEELKPGENGELKVTLENINTINLRDVKVALQHGDIDENTITMAQGSNEKIIERLESKTESTFVFDISISPDSQSKSYLVPIKISYEDSLENTYENTVYGSVKVFSEPELSLNLDSQDVYNVGKGGFTLAIANPGTSRIKGVQFKILDSESYEIIEGKTQYVGDLNPDDFQTLQGEMYIKNTDSATLRIQLNYLDSYDNKKEEIIEVPIKIYSEEELQKFGIAQEQKSSTGLIVVVLVLVIVGFIFWRRNKKKKNLQRARNNK